MTAKICVVSLGLAFLGSSGWIALQDSPACRTYATESTRAGTAAGTDTCDFDTATAQSTCTLSFGPGRRVTSTRQYASVADFVDEVRVIPPISRARSGATTYSPSGPGAQNAQLTFLYDAQRRQTEMTFEYSGRTVKTIYSEWDTFGRPTALTNSGQTLRYAYDDAKRTLTIRNTTAGGSQVHTFDVNGNLIKEEINPPAGSSTSTVVTVRKTAKVCR